MSSRQVQVKNRAPAPIQITAEQLLREAKERGLEDVPKAPQQYINDKEELLQYQNARRKDSEDQIRRNPHHSGIFMRYALWEASQKEFERSRSIFERSLAVDFRNQTTWQKYAEMEMVNKFVNHARNVWDRCVTIHPRVDVFWYKYSYMEEMVGAVDQARQVFERWMAWEPDDKAWGSYIKFEMRQGAIEGARALYERYTECNPTSRSYTKYAKWEEVQYNFKGARDVYERALVELHPDERSEAMLIAFARFEERSKEFDRARVIYKFALENTAQEENVLELNKEYIAFEKRHGTRKGIEDAIVNRRREDYEEKVKNDPYDYDAWFDYSRLEEAEGMDDEKTRDIYERAIANVPPVIEKRFWRRYVYLWINYALFEETHTKDIVRTRAVYKACLAILPNKSFSFGKVWLMAADLEVRQKDLAAARKILGMGIGLCSKEKIFKGYIELEMQLGEVDRCRSIYSKYLEHMPYNVSAWQALATLETNCGEVARARGVYELAVCQPVLDMPELLWKSYIDFEIEEDERDKVRSLYTRLLDRTSHVKVWLSLATFESNDAKSFVDAANTSNSSSSSEEAKITDTVAIARAVYDKAYTNLKQQGLKEERVVLLEAWRESERGFGSYGNVSTVESKLPRKIKMRKMATDEDGNEIGWEEYYDYNFPDDEKKVMGFKILENAMKWKNAAAAALEGKEPAAEDAEGEDEDDSMLGKRKASSSGLVDEEIDIDDE
mmetsp:Transcript_19117/g.18446  ORF Transcript_19117/g.18446 Transcript_19117/m.18446 type:complete len:725 (-) Transcript_19117:635-2809(-)|eukprot:CAMPEP_0119038722 /NCGR_PEP_ID=MMETSP1177-20130426/7810_1 /TAXON_ID=2985 /ORGANISM="Ochromonas sp, Strain CCMP1899" /LENGTH=724 /DNA_ID=CAMNT_0007001673 /DNA_START=143 /DNA_END=2317 /DNA_ORIENTATION=+